MIILHQMEISPFGEKVRRVLHLKRRPYEVREVPLSGTLVRGVIPVLEHAGQQVSDSGRIARYLDRAFPEPPLFPEDPRERALCVMIEDWADESLHFYDLFFRFGLRENAPEQARRSSESEPPLLRRAAARAMPTFYRNVLKAQGLGRQEPAAVVERFGQLLGSLAEMLSGREWLVADELTLADIAVYAQLTYACDTGEASAILAEHDDLMRWMERVNAATLPTA